MTESFEQLEKEIDAALAKWSDALDVVPPGETIERTKTTTRIALDEALLADTPVPSEETIDRVRNRVREELSVGGVGPRQRTRGARKWHLSPSAIRAWAAAAVIAIALGLIYYTHTIEPNGSAEEPSIDDVVINRFIAVNETLMPSSSLTTSISSEIDTLEESISTWEPARSELDELFESLDSEVSDQSRAGSESDRQIASIRTPVTGVMG